MGQVLLVSANPLFTEVIAESLLECPDLELFIVPPEAACDAVGEKHPDTILIDDQIGEEAIKELLHVGRSQERIRVLLLSIEKNDIIVISKHKETIVKASDLVRAISD